MSEVKLREKHSEELKCLEEEMKAQGKFAEAVKKKYDDFVSGDGCHLMLEYRKAAVEASKIVDEILQGDRKFVYTDF